MNNDKLKEFLESKNIPAEKLQEILDLYNSNDPVKQVEAYAQMCEITQKKTSN